MTSTDHAEGTGTLTGITTEDGQCDRCSRELGKVFEVRFPDGVSRTYGRRCCAKMTGWKPSQLENGVRMAQRAAVIAERTALVAEAFPQFEAYTGPGERFYHDAPRFTIEATYVITNDRVWPEGWRQALESVG